MATATANVTIGGSQTDFFVDLTALELEIEADYIMNQAEIEAKNHSHTYGVSEAEGWDFVLNDLENFDSPDYGKNGGLFRGAKTRIQRTIREQTKHMVAKPVEELAKNKGQLFFWELGIVKSDHCGDCFRHSRMGAKTKEQWMELGKGLPRWGMTECNIGCRCMLRPTAKGSGTTKVSNKAIKSGVVTQGLGKATSGVVKGAPLNQSTKKQVKDTTAKLKGEVKKKKAEAEVKKLTQDEINVKAQKMAYKEALDWAKAHDKATGDNYSQYMEWEMYAIKNGKAHPDFIALTKADPDHKWDLHYNGKKLTDAEIVKDATRGMVDWLTGGEDIGRQNFLMKAHQKLVGNFEKAQTVTLKDFDGVVKSRGNGNVYHRGMDVTQKQSESLFKTKNTWAGKGYYGDGVYCANPSSRHGESMGVANAYANDNPKNLFNSKGFIVRFTMEKGSKVVDYNDIAGELKIERAFAYNDAQKVRKISKKKEQLMDEAWLNPQQVLNADIEEFFVRGAFLNPVYKGKYNHLQNEGTYGVHEKYDMINVGKISGMPTDDDMGYSVVLNRSKMIMVDTAGKVRSSWKAGKPVARGGQSKATANWEEYEFIPYYND